MSLSARCPGCGTVFRVRTEQLQAYHGQVRCGRCSRVFNAFETLEAAATPALAPLPSAPTDSQRASPPAPAATPAPGPFPEPAPEWLPEPAPEPGSGETSPAPGPLLERLSEPLHAPAPAAPAEPQPEQAAPGAEASPPEPEAAEETIAPPEPGEAQEPAAIPEPGETEDPIAIPEGGVVDLDLSDVAAPAVLRPGRREHPSPFAHLSEDSTPDRPQAPAGAEPEAHASGAAAKPEPKRAPNRPVFVPVALEEEEEPPRRTWAWGLGALLLLLALAGQVAYLFRVDIAAQLPGARPWLEQACALAGCTVPLPRQVEKVLIESSDLRAEGQRASVMTLVATLRNYAAHTQAYPHLELTLTDTRDEPVARRIFEPADYLKAPAAQAEGMAPNRPVDLRLLLDSGDLQPAGYRLFLFYP